MILFDVSGPKLVVKASSCSPTASTLPGYLMAIPFAKEERRLNRAQLISF